MAPTGGHTSLPSGGTGAVGNTESGGASGLNVTSTTTAAGGSLVFGDSLTEVCIATVLSACQRENECLNQTLLDCVGSTFSCPDIMFSDGSTRTIDNAKQCATQYPTTPCDQMLSGSVPNCTPPGTKQRGEACKYGLQCASTLCKTVGSCGVCAQTVGVGESCANSVANVCEKGLACSNGTCVVSTSQQADAGQDCTTISCMSGLYCQLSTRVCMPLPTAGQSCKDSQLCTESYCDDSSLICNPYPSVGAACGTDARSHQADTCARGLFCNPSLSQPTCASLPQLGEPCAVDPVTKKAYTTAFCAPNLRCDFDATPPTCSPLHAKGEVCVLKTDCAEGLRCLCPDASTSCATLHCVELQFAHEPCADPSDVCHPGFACTNGECVARDSQGLAAKCEKKDAG